MTASDRRIALSLAAAAGAAAIPPVWLARAETYAEDATTPLALVRRADVVAVVTAVLPRDGAPGGFRVEEALRGEPATGTVLGPGGDAARPGAGAHPGKRELRFFRRRKNGTVAALPDAIGAFEPDGTPGGRAAGAASVFRALAAAVGRDGRILSAAPVRAALVRAAGSGEPRLAAGAALDLLREPGLLAAATDSERVSLVEAFRAEPAGTRAKGRLAEVVGRLRPPGAAAMLVDALLADGGAPLRPAVGRALRDLGDPKAIALLASRSANPDPKVRALVAGTLGETGAAAARPFLEALLSDRASAVRLDAALGLGGLGDVAAGPALLRRFRGAPPVAPEEDSLVRRALCWALARCDVPDAWAALREAAHGDSDPLFRAYAAEVLRNPARGFVR